jgi:hypothetical protein
MKKKVKKDFGLIVASGESLLSIVSGLLVVVGVGSFVGNTRKKRERIESVNKKVVIF